MLTGDLTSQGSSLGPCTSLDVLLENFHFMSPEQFIWITLSGMPPSVCPIVTLYHHTCFGGIEEEGLDGKSGFDSWYTLACGPSDGKEVKDVPVPGSAR